jgi:hypothetical protein
MEARKATNDEWLRYYAETAPRAQHGANDPIERLRIRWLVRERLGIVAAVGALTATVVTYVALLGP